LVEYQSEFRCPFWTRICFDIQQLKNH